MYNFEVDCLIVQNRASKGHILSAITFLDCCFVRVEKEECNSAINMFSSSQI
jgi:hypothetical protein